MVGRAPRRAAVCTEAIECYLAVARDARVMHKGAPLPAPPQQRLGDGVVGHVPPGILKRRERQSGSHRCVRRRRRHHLPWGGGGGGEGRRGADRAEGRIGVGRGLRDGRPCAGRAVRWARACGRASVRRSFVGVSQESLACAPRVHPTCHTHLSPMHPTHARAPLPSAPGSSAWARGTGSVPRSYSHAAQNASQSKRPTRWAGSLGPLLPAPRIQRGLSRPRRRAA